MIKISKDELYTFEIESNLIKNNTDNQIEVSVDSFDLGIESVSDKKTFINEWNNYLKNKNSEQAQKFLVEVSN